MKKTILTLTAAATTLAFSSCATNPYGPGASNAQRDATTGAAAGAVIGGIIGNQSGDALEGAAIGAAIGGLGGHAVGTQKDQQYRR